MAKAEVPTEEVETDEVPTVVPTVEDKVLAMATLVITGEVFNGEESEIADFQVKFQTFLKGMGGIAKEFDRQLKGKREANGADYLPTVKYNRKPREKSTTNSLLDSLKL